jgi:hypothetical protein
MVKKASNPYAVRDYLKARDFRYSRAWYYNGTSLTTEVNGKILTSEEFDEKYPIPKRIQFYLAEENPDTTKSYLL